MGGGAVQLFFGMSIVAGLSLSALSAFVLFCWFVNSVGLRVSILGLGLAVFLAALPFLMDHVMARGVLVGYAVASAGNLLLAVISVYRNRGRALRQSVPIGVILIYVVVGIPFVAPTVKTLEFGGLGSILGLVLFVGGGPLLSFVLFCICHENLQKWGIWNVISDEKRPSEDEYWH